MLNTFGCILGIGNIMLEASCLKPLKNATVHLDLSYKWQCYLSALCLECLYLVFSMLVELPSVFPSATQAPMGGPGNNAVYDEIYSCPA